MVTEIKSFNQNPVYRASEQTQILEVYGNCRGDDAVWEPGTRKPLRKPALHQNLMKHYHRGSPS